MKTMLIILLLLPSQIFGQLVNSSLRDGKQDIYNDALTRYIGFIEKTNSIHYDTLFVIKAELITDSLNARLADIPVKIMDGPDISSKIDRETSFVLYKIAPLAFDKSQFYLPISCFVAKKEGGKVNLSYTQTCHVIYSFDNIKKNFRFQKIECFGV